MGSNPTPRTTTTPTTFLPEFEAHLRSKLTKKGFSLAESTIIHRVKAIKSLAKHVNIWDSDAVEKHINEAEWTNGRKEHVGLAYSNWCVSKGFEYTPRKYPRQIKLPYVPTEKEIDQLIGGFSDSKYGPFLQLLKETAMRAGEAKRLDWIDIDHERRIITLNHPEKGSKPRIWKNIVSAGWY